MLVHPDTEAECPAAVQAALDSLHYGCVAVNTMSGAAFTVQQVRCWRERRGRGCRVAAG